MITVNLRDRLGNRLFQYAAAKQLALRHKTTLRLSLNSFGRGRHGYGKKQIDEMCSIGVEAGAFRYERLKNYYRRRFGLTFSDPKDVYVQPTLGFDPDFNDLPNGIFLKGHFQSERYFQGVADLIRQTLSFSLNFIAPEHKSTVMKMHKEPSIGLHVRRGDYLDSPMFQVCTRDYYQIAVDRLRSLKGHIPVYIFSDDPAWCKEALQIPNSATFDSSATTRCPSYDLKVMSLCHHQIISNSTYSWWASWLNPNPEKVVLVPYRWFDNEDYNRQIIDDIIPDRWTRVHF